MMINVSAFGNLDPFDADPSAVFARTVKNIATEIQ